MGADCYAWGNELLLTTSIKLAEKRMERLKEKMETINGEQVEHVMKVKKTRMKYIQKDGLIRPVWSS